MTSLRLFSTATTPPRTDCIAPPARLLSSSMCLPVSRWTITCPLRSITPTPPSRRLLGHLCTCGKMWITSSPTSSGSSASHSSEAHVLAEGIMCEVETNMDSRMIRETQPPALHCHALHLRCAVHGSRLDLAAPSLRLQREGALDDDSVRPVGLDKWHLFCALVSS